MFKSIKNISLERKLYATSILVGFVIGAIVVVKTTKDSKDSVAELPDDEDKSIIEFGED